MTMVVGFLCRDGVVIGADTQVTGANYTFPECKLLNFEWHNGSGILGYAGDRDLFKSFSRDLLSSIHDGATLNDDDIRATLIDCLAALKARKDALLIMAGYWIDGSRFPSLVNSTSSQKLVDVADCEVIGYADSPLARYLLGRFRELPRVTVQQARLYAVDFIAQAKKYDGNFVGGDINLYSIEDHDCEIWPRATSGAAIVRECKYTRMITSGMDEWEREIGQLNSALDQYVFDLTNRDQELSPAKLSGPVKVFRSWANR
ncbi:MAG: hypothetical protein ABSA80_12590 [Terriglobales bacterium]